MRLPESIVSMACVSPLEHACGKVWRNDGSKSASPMAQRGHRTERSGERKFASAG
jgi:hypothetical protein